jgi:hypothetical protein
VGLGARIGVMGEFTFMPASESDQARVIATLVSAFIEDPVERWLFPEPAEYLTHFPVFVAAFGGEAFRRQTVWRLGEFAAASMWIPPGAKPDAEAIVAVLSNFVSPEKHKDAFAVLEQMDQAHPSYTHWYLPWLGVDPRAAGLALAATCWSSASRSSMPIICPSSGRTRARRASRGVPYKRMVQDQLAGGPARTVGASVTVEHA